MLNRLALMWVLLFLGAVNAASPYVATDGECRGVETADDIVEVASTANVSVNVCFPATAERRALAQQLWCKLPLANRGIATERLP